jgi:hypothetical protein
VTAGIVDYRLLYLVDTIIQGPIFLWIIHIALNLGVRDKKERETQQVRAEIEGQEVSPLVSSSKH